MQISVKLIEPIIVVCVGFRAVSATGNEDERLATLVNQVSTDC